MKEDCKIIVIDKLKGEALRDIENCTEKYRRDKHDISERIEKNNIERT